MVDLSRTRTNSWGHSTSYPEATSLLTALLQASHTNALLTSTQKMLRHRLPLGSYLLKPVQRILKYHLLLEVSAHAKRRRRRVCVCVHGVTRRQY